MTHVEGLDPPDDPDPFDDPDHPGHSRVPRHLWDYARDHSLLAEAAEDLRRFLTDLAAEGAVKVHTVEARAKTLVSYRDKSLKERERGVLKYDRPAEQICDCIAARVILFTRQARDDFAGLLLGRARVVEQENPGDQKHNGYDSQHFVITSLADPSSHGQYVALARFLDKYPGLEVQLRSVAAHAWAEYEHDVRYKSPAYHELPRDHRAHVDQKFVEAGGMRRMMDTMFDEIQALLYPTGDGEPTDDALDDIEVEPVPRRGDAQDQEGPRTALDTGALAGFIQSRYPRAAVGDVPAVTEVLHHLEAVSVTTVEKLESLLAELETGRVERLMDYPTRPSGVRLLDDELLTVFTDRYVEGAREEDRRRILQLRLGRVKGRFAIYTIHDGRQPGRPVAAARAVRDLAVLVAQHAGPDAAEVPDAVSRTSAGLSGSTRPRTVRAGDEVLHIATNFSRALAEEVMIKLVDAAPGSGLRVARAGDVICEAPEHRSDEAGEC